MIQKKNEAIITLNMINTREREGEREMAIASNSNALSEHVLSTRQSHRLSDMKAHLKQSSPEKEGGTLNIYTKGLGKMLMRTSFSP